MSPLPPRRALAAVALALLVPLAWQLGRLSGREAGPGAVPGASPGALPDGAGASGAATGEAAGEPTDGRSVRPEPSAVERLAAERDVALATVRRLEERLGEATRAASDDAAELALYRRIESGSGARGLSVDSVELVDAGTERAALAITLVQFRGRHRVTGSLSARLVDDEGAPGDGPNGDPGDGTPLGDGPSAFGLRFFEAVRVPLGDAASALPGAAAGPSPRVAIDVRPDGDRHDPFVAIVALDPNVDAGSGE